ncbi:MAG: BamA/TamA family outer membrane protein [Roseovarius sp.]
MLVLFCLARAATATEVFIQLPPEAQGLQGHLSRASITMQTVAREDATPQDIIAAARAEYARLSGALYEVGRYGGVISVLVDGREAAEMSPFATPQAPRQILLRVQPGPQFTFSQATVRPLAPGTELPEGFRTGQPAFSGLVADAAQAGQRRWRDTGHAKVDVAEQNITANHNARALAADIVLAPGPRLTFGNLVITNPGDVRPERVRAIAGLPTGEVYSPAALEEAAQRLRRTGAFSSVALQDAERIGPGNTLDINATLTDARPRRIGFGAEISSLEGLTLSGFWMHRNLFGGAERLRLEGEVGGIGGNSGGIDYIFSARYERPATFTPDTTLYLGARVQDLDEPEYSERSVRVGAGVTHIFNDTLTGDLGFAYQYADIRDDLGTRELEHLLFPASLTYDTRDDPLDAKKGIMVDFELTPLVGLGNNSLGARLFLDSRSYFTFGANDGLTFATRGQFGSVTGAGLTEVPPEMLFFSGGAGTVRGQPYQSLAVLLAPGVEIGGRTFAAVSAELRADITDTWQVVGFADGGFVGASSMSFDNGDEHYGAGFGIRYKTGLGPIRFDVATPLDSDAGRDFEIYVGIGQAF